MGIASPVQVRSVHIAPDVETSIPQAPIRNDESGCAENRQASRGWAQRALEVELVLTEDQAGETTALREDEMEEFPVRSSSISISCVDWASLELHSPRTTAAVRRCEL